MRDFCNVIWKEAVPLENRPYIIMDSRFLSTSALRWLLQARRGPFVASINRAWHSLVAGAFARLNVPQCGSVTLYRGSQMLFEDRHDPQSGLVAVLLNAKSSEEADDAAAVELTAAAAARRHPAASAAVCAAAAGGSADNSKPAKSSLRELCGPSMASANSEAAPKKRRGRPRKIAAVLDAPTKSVMPPFGAAVSSVHGNNGSSGMSAVRDGGDKKRKSGGTAAATVSTAEPRVNAGTLFRELNAISDGDITLPAKRIRHERYPHLHDEVLSTDDEQVAPPVSRENSELSAKGGDQQEEVEMCLQFNPTDMYLTLEKYSGVYLQKRRSSMYLISNFINEFERTEVRGGGAGSPLYATFSGQWRACDVINESAKYQRMLYHHNVKRHCRDDQIRFDFVLTSALQAVHVLTAKFRNQHTHSQRLGQYSWQEFGVEAAKILFNWNLSIRADAQMKVIDCISLRFNVVFLTFL